MGGIGFYHRLKKNRDTRNIPFLFFTAYDSQKIIPELKSGDSLIAKPIQWKELIRKIDLFLEKRARAAQKHKAKAKAVRADENLAPEVGKRPAAITTPTTTGQHKNPPKTPATGNKKKGVSGEKPGKKAKRRTMVVADTTRASKDASAPTQDRKQPATPEELRLKASTTKSKKKRRKSPLGNFSPQHLAQYLRRFAEYYSTPSSPFDAKEIRSSTGKLFKRSKEYQTEPMQFVTNEIPMAGLREQLITPNRVRNTQSLFELEEDGDILLDIDVEDIDLEDGAEEIAGIQFRVDSEDDEILVELDEELDEAELKESLEYRPGTDQPTPEQAVSANTAVIPANAQARACLKSCVSEYQCSDEMVFAYLNNQTGEFTSTLATIEKEKYGELGHALFSMAGLCLQMFSREFTARLSGRPNRRQGYFYYQRREKRRHI